MFCLIWLDLIQRQSWKSSVDLFVYITNWVGRTMYFQLNFCAKSLLILESTRVVKQNYKPTSGRKPLMAIERLLKISSIDNNSLNMKEMVPKMVMPVLESWYDRSISVIFPSFDFSGYFGHSSLTCLNFLQK